MLINDLFYVLTITNAESMRNFRLYLQNLSLSDSVIVEIIDSSESLNFINIYFELLLAERGDWSILRKLNIISLNLSVSSDMMLCRLVGVYQSSIC
jgi:hypothetical protein